MSEETKGASRLLQSLIGKRVKLAFFDEEADVELYDTACTVIDFEGNWMKVEADIKKDHIEKLIPVSSIRAIEIVGEGA